MDWLMANAYTILVAGAVAGAVGLALRSMIRDKKQGKTCCGDCSRCGGCH